MAGQRDVQASGVGAMLLRSALLTRKQPELNYRGTGVSTFCFFAFPVTFSPSYYFSDLLPAKMKKEVTRS